MYQSKLGFIEPQHDSQKTLSRIDDSAALLVDLALFESDFPVKVALLQSRTVHDADDL